MVKEFHTLVKISQTRIGYSKYEKKHIYKLLVILPGRHELDGG